MDLTSKLKKIKKTPTTSESSVRKLKILVTIVNRSKAEFYADFLSGFEANFQASVLAQGTAKSDTLSLLGLEDSEKSVLFSVVREDRAAEIMLALDEKFHTLKNGKGIAFTIPVSSVIGVAIYRFLSNHTSA